MYTAVTCSTIHIVLYSTIQYYTVLLHHEEKKTYLEVNIETMLDFYCELPRGALAADPIHQVGD